DGSETLTDSFTYTINDGATDSAPATVSITITTTNDAPMAADDSAAVIEGSNVIIDLRSNDSDEETPNNALTLSNISSATNGSIINNNDGTVTYTHDGSETLTDSFTYTINDGATDSAPATVSITVTPVNDTPVLVATPTTANVPEDAQNNDAVTTVVATDPEGDSQTWSITAGNDDGVFGVDNAGNVTLVDVSSLDFETTNQYIITVRAEDSAEPTVFSTIDITVNITDVIENQVFSVINSFGLNGNTTFNTYSFDTTDTIVSTLRQSDGKFIQVVNTNATETKRIAITRLNPDGSVDLTYGFNGYNLFDLGVSQVANHATLDGSDNLYITGFDDNGSGTNIMVMKVTNNGLLDTSFDSDGKIEPNFASNSNPRGQAILLHSSGNLYIAADGFNFGQTNLQLLKMIRIDLNGNLVSLNADGGLAEFDIFASDFYPHALAELSTGELVVSGHEDSNGAFNIAATVITQDDFTLAALTSASFNFGSIFSDFTSNDSSTGMLDFANDSYLITGTSDFINGGNTVQEAMLLKINVTTSAINRDLTFANNGLFNADVDGNNTVGAAIESAIHDSSGDITFIAQSTVTNNAYFVEKLTNLGGIDLSFNAKIYPTGSSLAGANIILEPANDNFYLSYHSFIGESEDIFFQQLLNDGSEVTTTNHTLSFKTSDESLVGIDLLSGPIDNGKLLLVSDKLFAPETPSGTLSLLNSDGSHNHHLNKGNSTVAGPDIFYGPTLELSDGSIFTASIDPDSQLRISKYTDTNFVYDANFAPSFGYVDISIFGFTIIEDIQYDAATDHIVVVGTVLDSGADAYIVKINATDGSLYNGGNFSAGLAIIDITGSFNDDTLVRILPQADGNYIGLGTTNITGNLTPYLMKIDGNANFVTSFNGTGLKTNLGLPISNFITTDIVQLADNSIVLNAYDTVGNLSYWVKTDNDSNLDNGFSTSGVLVLDFGGTATFIDDLTLDDNENIYGVGSVSLATDDALLVKVTASTGTLDPLLNAFSTQGYWLMDEGGNEKLTKIVFDPALNRIILADTVAGPTTSIDLRVRAFELIQDDNR
ncbi:MAG: Ig-like domain-containing protein, partial [Thalassotalea sp.]